MLKFPGLLAAVMVALAASVSAETPAPEPAIAHSFTDTELQWGACPPFIPAGCEIAVLHGDPAQENADIFLKVPGNFTIPDHWHTSAERIVLVSGELTVTYEGQEATKLKTGMYAYGPAKRPHVAVCSAGPPCVLFIAFESAVDAIPTEETPEPRP